MKFTGTITQIVTWERKNEYFAPWESRDGKQYDCVCVDKGDSHFIPNRGQGLWKRLFAAEPRIVEDFPVVGDWFNFWVERPHKFKKGDLIEIEVNLSQGPVRLANLSEVVQ